MHLLATFALLVACSTSDKPAGSVDTAAVDDTPDSDADGFTLAEGDCDDADAGAFPGAVEFCDGVDQDCDGAPDNGVTTTWYTDADGDGYGDAATAHEACEAAQDDVSNDADCDDTLPRVNPEAAEVCDDVDNDCDGSVDDGVGETWYADSDGDGFGDSAVSVQACAAPDGYTDDASDCNDATALAQPGGTETCDELDNDCDGLTDEGVTTTWFADLDADGYGDASLTQEACALPTGYAAEPTDCDDANSSVHPDADEFCNSIDDDCDAEVDEPSAVDATDWYTDADGDAYGDPATVSHACTGAPGAVADGTDCNDTDASLNPDTPWYVDSDSDGFGNASYALLQCEAPAGYVRDSTDCNDGVAAVNPAAAEACNDYDDDCDGLVDDADSPVVGTSTWHPDADGDGYGSSSASVAACDAPAGTLADGRDCDDTDASVYPGGAESWYDSVDGDCDGDLDPSVCDDLPDATTVAWDPSCAGAYSTTGWTVATEWTTDSSGYYASGSTYDQVMVAPVVGNVTDDNADGRIDDLDTPDIVYTSFLSTGYSDAGYLRVVSGDGAGDLFNIYNFRYPYGTGSLYYIAGTGGAAIGDLEGDGEPEIVTMTSAGDVVAFSPSTSGYGTTRVKWFYDAAFSEYAYPTLGDMDGDGRVEVAIGPTILNYNGTLRGTCAVGSSGLVSTMGDVDGDGDLDLSVGSAVCKYDGSTLWNSARTAGYSAVGQFDLDRALEVVNVAGTRAELYDHNGTLITYYSLSDGGGTPAVADIDGDGLNEILVSDANYLVALDPVDTTGDGRPDSFTRKWRISIDDSSSRSAAVSTFDFDGNGAAEIAYADEHTVWILNGSTGASLWSSTSHESGTLREMPVVADVDRDGRAELVVASNDYNASGWAGIHVLGETNGKWASARTTFLQHGLDVGLTEDDNSYHTSAVGSGTMRAQESWSAAPNGAANLELVWLGVCPDCTNAETDVYVALDNTGAVFVPDGVPIVVYAVNGSTLTEITRTTTTAPIDPGVRTASIRLTIPNASIGTSGLRVVVDPSGVVVECDETDNTVNWNEAVCR